MTIEEIRTAAQHLASQITDCMKRVREFNPDVSSFYVASLVVADDFDYLALYANTKTHFEQSSGDMVSKWGFAEWWSEGLDMNSDPLAQNIGVVDDFDEEPQNDKGPAWLATMTEALWLANNEDAFVQDDDPPVLFCSMIDSTNAKWLEHLSANYLNPSDSYSLIESELTTAQNKWYGKGKSGNPEFKNAYVNILEQLPDAR